MYSPFNSERHTTLKQKHLYKMNFHLLPAFRRW